MADTVLESYLIKLGYQVDAASSKRFTTAIHDGLKGVMEFTTAIIGMAVAVEEAVRRTANQMARLSFAATMGGTSVTKLREYGSAIEAVGGTMGELVSAQEALNQKLTEAPWLKGYFKSMVHSANMDIQSVIKRYHELSSGPRGEEGAAIFSKIMREQFGIDMRMAEMAHRHWKEYQDTLTHNQRVSKEWTQELKNAEAGSAKLWAAQTKLSFTIGTVWQSLIGGLSGVMAGVFDKFDKWLQGSAPLIQSFIKEMTPLIQHITDVVLNWIDDLLKHPEKIKQAWDSVTGFISNAWEGAKHIFTEVKKLVCDLVDAFDWLADHVGGKTNAALLLFFGWMAKDAILLTFGRALGGLTRRFGLLRLGILAAVAALAKAAVDEGVGTKRYDPEKAQREGGLIGHVLGWLGMGGTVHELTKEHKGILEGGSLGETAPVQFFKWLTTPHQAGGVVPSMLHPGEMVLPAPISAGLQQLYGTGNWGQDIGHWLQGDETFQPVMRFVSDVYDKMTDAFEEALRRVWPDAGGGGPGGGGPGGGGPGGGGGGGGGGDGTPDPNAAIKLPGNMQAPGAGSRGDPRGMIPVIRAAAIAAGVDPDIAVRVAQSEGLAKFLGDHGKSGGAFQLYTGGGLGNEFQKETGLNPLDPKNEAATIYWAMMKVRQTGWSPWHGAKHVGVYGRQGIGALPSGATGVPPDGGGTVTPGGGGMEGALQTMLQYTGEFGNNPHVRKFIMGSGAKLDPMNALWCAAFLRAAMGENGVITKADNMARSFMNVGSGVAQGQEQRGDIAVAKGMGHVAAVLQHVGNMVQIIAGDAGGPGSHPGHRMVWTRWANENEFYFRRIEDKHKQIVQTAQREQQAAARKQTPEEMGSESGSVVRTPGDYTTGNLVSGLKPPVVVDNSVNTTHIHGITDPHGVHRVVADLGDRRGSQHKKNRRTHIG